MKIFVKVSEFCAPADSREEQQNQILRTLQNEYCDAVSDREAYLAVDCCTEDDFIFGVDAPETIREAAENWNNAIKERLWEAIKNFQRMPRDATLYDLKKAALAADDDLYEFAEEAVLIPEEKGAYCYLHPKLHDEQYKQVVRNPADFAIVEVTAK